MIFRPHCTWGSGVRGAGKAFLVVPYGLLCLDFLRSSRSCVCEKLRFLFSSCCPLHRYILKGSRLLYFIFVISSVEVFCFELDVMGCGYIEVK